MSNRIYTTSKGTELPLLNLRGRDYLEVKYRIVWFREDHPDWSIETELLSVTDVSAYAKAMIKDEKGRIIATSHKFETIQGFPDFIEKAETGSIGRALALIGYGTQFCADELDEGNRIVDAPAAPVQRGGTNLNRRSEVQRNPELAAAPSGDSTVRVSAEDNLREDEAEPAPMAEPGDFMINFGRKYKGKRLRDIPKAEIESYIKWLENSDVRPGTALSHQVQYLKSAYEKLYQIESANTAH